MADAQPMSVAADPVAPAATPGATPRRKMKFRNKLLLYFVSFLMIGFLRTGFVFVIIGLLPSIVAYLMDVTSDRHNFRTVFACNLAGMLPYLGKMVQHGPAKSEVLQKVMGDLNSWVIIYGAALVGLMLVKICPMLAQFFVVGIARTQVSHIENVQKRIESEWGPEVAQFSQANIDASAHDDDHYG